MPGHFFGKGEEGKMKRVLGIAFALLTLGFVVPAEAKAAENSHENATISASSAPQWQQRNRYRRYDRRRARTVTRSRIVQYGRRVYRETYAVTYYANGRIDTRLINRTRIG
jgi:hypothetical protein